MKRLILLALATAAASLAQSTTSIVGNNVETIGGVQLSAGSVCFVPNAIPVLLGVTGSASYCAAVTSGHLATLAVPSSAAVSSPSNLTYTINITDTGVGHIILSMPLVQVSGATFSLDSYAVASGTNPVGYGQPFVNCNPGAVYTETDGAPGDNTWVCTSINGVHVWYSTPAQPSGVVTIGTYQGSYDATKTYLAGQIVLYNGVSYISLVNSNYNNQPDTSSTFWGPLVTSGGGGGSGITTVSTLPGTCTVGQLFEITGVPYKHALYSCPITNTFKLITDNDGSISPLEFTGVDPTGTTDSKVGLQAWLDYSVAHKLSLHVPSGKYLVNGTLYLTYPLWMNGDGGQTTCFIETNTTADLLVVNETSGHLGASGGGWSTGATITNMCFGGEGVTTTGNLLVNNSAGHTIINNNNFNGTKGTGILMQNERGYYGINHFSHVRRAFATNDNTALNETYFVGNVIMDPGKVQNDLQAGGDLTTVYCASVNSTSGVYPSTGTLVQDLHAGGYALNGNLENILIEGGSIKSTQCAAGIKLHQGSGIEISHIYAEGAANGFINPSFIMGGNHEKTVLPNAITSSQTTFDITDGQWFLAAVGNVADLPGGNGMGFLLRCPDFVAGSTTACAIGGGRLQGDYEYINYQGIVHNATGSGWHLVAYARGYNGPAALAWPVGTIVEEGWNGYTTGGGRVDYASQLYGNPVSLRDDHLLGVYPSTASPFTVTCDPTTEKTCGEIVVGPVPDAFFLVGSAQLHQSIWGISIEGGTRSACGPLPAGGAIEIYGPVQVDATKSNTMQNSIFDSSGSFGDGYNTPGSGFSFCGGIRRTQLTNTSSQLNYTDKWTNLVVFGSAASPTIRASASSNNNSAIFNTPSTVLPEGTGYNWLGFHPGGTVGGTNAPYRMGFTPNGLAWYNNGSQIWALNNVGELITINDVQSGNFFGMPDQGTNHNYFWPYQAVHQNILWTADDGSTLCVGGYPTVGQHNSYCRPMYPEDFTFTNTVSGSVNLNFSFPHDFYEIVLTGNVTSSNFANWFPGNRYTLNICQDSVGSRTFAPPAGIANWPASLNSGANQCTAINMESMTNPTATSFNTLYVVSSNAPGGGGGGGGSMVYPPSGVACSTGSTWCASYSTTGTGNVVLSDSSTLSGNVTVANLTVSGTCTNCGGSGGGNVTVVAGYGVCPDTVNSTSTTVYLDSCKIVDTSQPTTLTRDRGGRWLEYTGNSVSAVGLSGGVNAFTNSSTTGTANNDWFTDICNKNSTATITFTVSGTSTINGATLTPQQFTVAVGHHIHIQETTTDIKISGADTCTGATF